MKYVYVVIYDELDDEGGKSIASIWSTPEAALAACGENPLYYEVEAWRIDAGDKSIESGHDLNETRRINNEWHAKQREAKK